MKSSPRKFSDNKLTDNDDDDYMYNISVHRCITQGLWCCCWSYHGAYDGVENDGAELVEERACWHEVARINDDWRQQDEEEGASVELMTLAVSSITQVQHHTDDHSEHYEQTTLRHQLQQLQLSVIRYRHSRHTSSLVSHTDAVN